MMTCAGTICAVLPFLAGGAYIAIMLAVVGVPQLLIHYFDHRSRHRDRQEDLAIAAERRREDLAAAEQRRQEDEQRRREDEQRHREDTAAAERRHQENMAMLGVTLNAMTTMAAAMMDNRQPAPPPADSAQAAAITDLQQSVSELTQMVSEMRQQIQHGSVNDPTAAPFQ